MIEIKLDAAGALDLHVALSEVLFSYREMSDSSYTSLNDLHSVLDDMLLSILNRGVDNSDA